MASWATRIPDRLVKTGSKVAGCGPVWEAVLMAP